MNKPNQNTKISQDELDVLETIELVEYVDGYTPSDLQYDFNF